MLGYIVHPSLLALVIAGEYYGVHQLQNIAAVTIWVISFITIAATIFEVKPKSQNRSDLQMMFFAATIIALVWSGWLATAIFYFVAWVFVLANRKAAINKS